MSNKTLSTIPFSVKNDVSVSSKSNKQKNFKTKISFLLGPEGPEPEPNPLVRDTDIRIASLKKMSQIRNTAALYIVNDLAVLRFRDVYHRSEFFSIPDPHQRIGAF
jgi:hypothetical protein